MQIKKILIGIALLILQLLIIVMVVYITHKDTAQNYKKIGEDYGVIDGKYQVLNKIIEQVGELPKCTNKQYKDEKILMRVKGEEIFFAEKHDNFVSFCRG